MTAEVPPRDEAEEGSPSAETTSASGAKATRRPAKLTWKGVLLWSLALVVAIVGLWMWHRQRVVIDDSYITYRYARNLVRGEGLVYNPGERVEGYTNFLWVLFSSAFLAVGANPFVGTRAIGLIAFMLSALLCATSLVPLQRRRPFLACAVGVVLLVNVLPDGVASFAGSGMETPFVALCILLTGLLQHVFVPKTSRGRMLAGLAPLAACLTRMDAAVFVAASMLVVGIESLADETPPRRIATDLAHRYGIVVVGVGIWLLWKRAYYGDFLPNTYYAKAGNTLQLKAGLLYLEAFVSGSPYVLVLLPFAFAAATSVCPPHHRSFARFSLIGMSLYLAYVLKVGGDFMHYRFMFEVLPTFTWAAFAGLGALAVRHPVVSVACAVVAVVLAFHRPIMDPEYHMETMEEMDGCCGRTFVRLGKRLQQVLPPRLTISTTAAGSIPYFVDVPTIDEIGLTDRTIAKTGEVPEKIRRGHVKRATIEYLAERGVNLVIGHPIDCDCGAPCAEPGKVNVFVRHDGTCMRSLYLTQTPELTRHFCENPKDFLVTGMSCPSR